MFKLLFNHCVQNKKYLKVCESAVVVSLDKPAYTIMSGDSLTLTCVGANLNLEDLVWQITPISNTTSFNVIYLNQKLTSKFINKFNVTARQTSDFAIQSTLTINKVSLSDGDYSYQCVCNIYTACALGNKAMATANLTILTTTTSTTTTTTTTTTTSIRFIRRLKLSIQNSRFLSQFYLSTF